MTFFAFTFRGFPQSCPVTAHAYFHQRWTLQTLDHDHSASVPTSGESLILASGPQCIQQVRQRRGGRAVSSLMLLKDNSSSSPTESPGPVAEPGLAGDEAEQLLLEVVMWRRSNPFSLLLLPPLLSAALRTAACRH